MSRKTRKGSVNNKVSFELEMTDRSILLHKCTSKKSALEAAAAHLELRNTEIGTFRKAGAVCLRKNKKILIEFARPKTRKPGSHDQKPIIKRPAMLGIKKAA